MRNLGQFLLFSIPSILHALPAAAEPPSKSTHAEFESNSTERIMQQVDQLVESGNLDEAAVMTQQACSSMKSGDRSELAVCLTRLATIRIEQGRYGDATELDEKSLSIRKSVYGESHLHTAIGMTNLANDYYRSGDYESSLALLESALQMLGALQRNHYSGELLRELATVKNSLAAVRWELGQHERAFDLYEEVLSTKETLLGPRHLSVATVLNNLAVAHARVGHYEEAKKLHKRALSIRREALGSNHPQVAHSLSNLGVLYTSLGELKEAESVLKQAETVFRAVYGNNHPDVALTLNNLSAIYIEQGNVSASERTVKEALSIYEKTPLAEPGKVIASLENLAYLHGYVGEYELEELLYWRSVKLQRQYHGENHHRVAYALKNIAWIYYKQGRFDDAESLFQESLHLLQSTLGDDHYSIADCLSGLAWSHVEREEYEEAERLLQRALSIVEAFRGQDHSDTAVRVGDLAELYHRMGNVSKAESLYKRYFAIQEEKLPPNDRKFAYYLGALAILYFDMGKHSLGLELGKRSLSAEEHNLAHTLVVASESRRLSYAAKFRESTDYTISVHLMMIPDNTAMAELALTTVLRRKGRVLELAAQTNTALRRSLPKSQLHLLDRLADAQARYSMHVQQAHRDDPRLERQAQLSAITREQEKLWLELSEQETLAQLGASIDITDVQSSLPKGSALVEYVTYRTLRGNDGKTVRRYAAYLVFSDHIDWVELGDAEEIDKQVKTFRSAVMLRADPSKPGRVLFQMIMKPIIDRLHSLKHVFIAPDGALNLVPFVALPDNEGRYLIERFHFYTLNSGRDLLRPWKNNSQSHGPVVVVANPEGTNLPGTRYEASMIAKMFDDTVSIQDEDATESRLRNYDRPRLLHLATHGFFGALRDPEQRLDARSGNALGTEETENDIVPRGQQDNPLVHSWLTMSVPNRSTLIPNAQGFDDGKLTAYEISGWDLRGTELVTMSSCDTGQGEVLHGEGVLGLRRAFAIAGAEAQVMSLWKVSDFSTAKFMESYYRKLLAGEGRSEAMRQVQLEILRNDSRAHPKDWAAFVVVGEWTPLTWVRSRPGPPPVDPPRGCQASIAGKEKRGESVLLVFSLLSALCLERRRGTIYGRGCRLSSVDRRTDGSL